MPSSPPKKPEGKEAGEVDTTIKMSQESTITFKNTTQTLINLSKNVKMPNIWSIIKEHEDNRSVVAKAEDDTNSDKNGSLLCKGYLGDTEIRTDHEDKRKNQVTTTADKEDDTDSTATVTTAAFTSVCGPEWDDDNIEGLAEPTT